jgi:hypothetical protein
MKWDWDPGALDSPRISNSLLQCRQKDRTRQVDLGDCLTLKHATHLKTKPVFLEEFKIGRKVVQTISSSRIPMTQQLVLFTSDFIPECIFPI